MITEENASGHTVWSRIMNYLAVDELQLVQERSLQSTLTLAAGLRVEEGPTIDKARLHVDILKNYNEFLEDAPSGSLSDKMGKSLHNVWGGKGAPVNGENLWRKFKTIKATIRSSYLPELPDDIHELPSGTNLDDAIKKFIADVYQKEENLAELKKKNKAKARREKAGEAEPESAEEDPSAVRDDPSVPSEYQYRNLDLILLLTWRVFRTQSAFVEIVAKQATDKIKSRAMIRQDEDDKNPSKRAKKDVAEKENRDNHYKYIQAKVIQANASAASSSALTKRVQIEAKKFKIAERKAKREELREMFDLGIIDELTYHNDVRELYNEMEASTRPISLAVVGDAATKAPSQSPGSPASTTSQRDPANFTEEPDATRANASGSDSLPTSGVLLARGAAPSQAYDIPEHNDSLD